MCHGNRNQETVLREKKKFLRAKRKKLIPALISHAISDVFDVQRSMQGGQSLN